MCGNARCLWFRNEGKDDNTQYFGHDTGDPEAWFGKLEPKPIQSGDSPPDKFDEDLKPFADPATFRWSYRIEDSVISGDALDEETGREIVESLEQAVELSYYPIVVQTAVPA